MNDEEKRGYHFIDPGLCDVQPRLDFDTQVRCLTYLVRQIPELVSLPEGILFEIIPLQYLGGPYPAIGLYTETLVDTDERLMDLADAVTEQLEQLTKRVTISRLIEQSAHEVISWKDILARFDRDTDE